MDKETSSRISTIASDYANITVEEIFDKERLTDAELVQAEEHVEKVRTLAGSCLSQDETPGQHGKSEIVAELTDAQIALDPILHFFHYSHLPPKLQATSRTFFILAAHIVNTLPRNPERTVALRKLLEAKDAAVRANLPLPGRGTSAVASTKEVGIGELVEIGGADIDRDGPVDFGS